MKIQRDYDGLHNFNYVLVWQLISSISIRHTKYTLHILMKNSVLYMYFNDDDSNN